MPKLLCKQSLNRWILVALAACGLLSPAAKAQSTPSHKTAPKSSSKPSTASAPTHSTTPHSTTGHSTTAKKSSHSGKSTAHKATRKVKGQAIPSPDRINEIQQALAKNNAFPGTPSGKWDDTTVDAMKKFQSAHGLNPSGKIDALTLQKLGLGSETAGMGAPNIPPNSVANRLLSRNAYPSSQPE
jgi:murein L,D-transpeptidase YcbB/YkuD